MQVKRPGKGKKTKKDEKGNQKMKEIKQRNTHEKVELEKGDSGDWPRRLQVKNLGN